jgi:hypothetical protein
VWLCLRVGASDASGVRRDGARPSNRHTRARMCGGARLRDIKRLCASSVVSTNCSNCSWCTNGAMWASAHVRQVPIEGGRGDSSGMRATSSRHTLFSELEQSSAKIDLHCRGELHSTAGEQSKTEVQNQKHIHLWANWRFVLIAV